MHVALNLLFFKTVWLASLIGAGTAKPWLGLLLLAGFAAWHFTVSRTPRADATLALAALLTGLVLDTLFIRLGLLAYSEPLPVSGIAPFWVVLMWVNFGLTLNLSMRWLHGRLAAAALLGAIGGPLAYWAGVELNAATLLVEPARMSIIVGACWALAVPLLALAAERSLLPAGEPVYPPVHIRSGPRDETLTSRRNS